MTALSTDARRRTNPYHAMLAPSATPRHALQIIAIDENFNKKVIYSVLLFDVNENTRSRGCTSHMKHLIRREDAHWKVPHRIAIFTKRRAESSMHLKKFLE